MNIYGYAFAFVCDLVPDRDGSLTYQYAPQGGYNNRRGLILNRYGNGLFCRFRIPKTYKRCGVYIVTVNDEPMYVGECINLTSRFNTGYGQISPRNCFVGGQETNCRINKLILGEVLKGSMVKLWFIQTGNHKAIEKDIRMRQPWPWNRT